MKNKILLPVVMLSLLGSGTAFALSLKTVIRDQLAVAISNGEVGKIKTLLSAGVNPNKLDRGTTSYLALAVSDGDEKHKGAKRVDVVKALLNAKNINVNIQNEDGQTPLHVAIYRPEQNKEVITLLLKAGANPTIPDNNGQSAIDLANHYRRQFQLTDPEFSKSFEPLIEQLKEYAN